MKKKTEHAPGSMIATNKIVQREYFIEQRIEAGLQLQGWEMKSIRAGRVQMKESYVLIKNNEAWLFGTHISPLTSASTHVNPDPTRTRKLLLHRAEIDKLRGAIERKGYAVVPTMLYWKKGRVKCEIALGKGKKLHDVRATEKDKEWKRQQERLFKTH